MADQSVPIKGAAFTLYFTLYKSDGTVIANPGTYTKKISKDGGAVADCANAVTEVDTTYGCCSLVLSTTEMNADAVWVQVKDDTTGCVPVTFVLYPQPAATVYQTGDAYSRLGAPSGASIAADIGTRLATSGYTAPLDAAGTRTAVGLASANLDTQLAAANNGTPPSAATVAAAVWNEAMAGHGTAGTSGKALTDANNGTPPTVSAIRTEMDSNSTKLANLDAAVTTRLASASYTTPPTSGDIATAVWGAGARTLTSFGSLASDVATAVWQAATRTLSAFGFTVATSSDANVSAIKAKTDNLPSDPADESLLEAAISGIAVGDVTIDLTPVTNLIGTPAHGTVSADIAALDVGAGTGAVTWNYTLTNSLNSAPIADAYVWVTNDAGGTSVVASGSTNPSGVVTFYLDPGTYYVWAARAGWNFNNPDIEVVA